MKPIIETDQLCAHLYRKEEIPFWRRANKEMQIRRIYPEYTVIYKNEFTHSEL